MGNARALYKMYFTSEMRDPMETAEESACLRFAREFLPVVNKALAVVYSGGEPGGISDEETFGAVDDDVEVDSEIESDNADSVEPEGEEDSSARAEN